MSKTTEGVRSDEASLVARLTLEQKVRLLTGADSWSVHGESAVGLRPMVLSDGPAGVRGIRFDPENPSTSLPCPVALAATWDEQLVHDLALALGIEARAKGVDVLLGPTINIVRTPLSGRGFECFSEDPLLTSRIAVAYVRGVQEAGVAATAKHYVANDSETDRRSYDARISERVLRELYLPPFEACIAEANVELVMAAYNSVNGHSMTANPTLLHDLLKAEWGFRGVVVSDWSAARTTAPSALAGLDLVMPGPRGPWGDQLVAAVRAGTVPEAVIDDKVSRLLHLARWVGALGASADGAAPNRSAAAGRQAPALIDSTLLREVTARSFVLLSNPRGLLPVDGARLGRVALIGPNAIEPQTQGGGSVRVLPSVRTNLAASLRAALGSATALSVHQGCLTSWTIATPADGSLRDPVSGATGVRLEVRDPAGKILHDGTFPSSVLTWWDGLPEAVHLPGAEVVIRARYRAEADGPHVLGAAGVGRLRIDVDGSMLGEATTLVPKDVVEGLSRPPELRVPVQLKAGRDVEVRVEYRPGPRFVTMRLGIAPQLEDDSLIEEAAKAAAAADVVVVVVGSADGTESEGYDRETMVLPGRQDELVRRVAAVNANTVVVVNSGMPVLMPWADEVAAIIQVWFPGQAFGEALADVLLGTVEPGGRLPVSIPRVEADSPVLRAHPESGDLIYDEGLLVGYRGFDRSGTEPLFCFGHGLGYTDWKYESVAAASESVVAGQDLDLVVTVRNSGRRAGREVVQVYLEGPDDDPSRPLRTLAAFATVSGEPGEQVEARLTVPARLFARFDERHREWVWPPGRYTLHVGRSSRALRLSAHVALR
ncbi:MAG TPA: glycoside hydrolase family 3 C-terminal domain-containing protein [Candidatus Dormibacteraeota bacterium]|nr:glycoside hydrolase family 3 C-terminal domain-containing protein [Candidatus Dormibacteraeota bacterium]